MPHSSRSESSPNEPRRCAIRRLVPSFLELYERVEALGRDRSTETRVDASDVQGVVLHSYSELRHARYLLLELPEHGAGQWLRRLVPELQSATAPVDGSAVNVAFTRRGLERIGVPGSALQEVPVVFHDGMADPERSKMLADSGDSAPEHWAWGGPNTPPVDAVLMLFADTAARLATLTERHSARLSRAGGRVVHRLETNLLPGNREHFGFRSGIAQPCFASEAEERPGSLAPADPENTVQPGELLLGYTNQFGQVTPSLDAPAELDPENVLPRTPSGAASFGKNGSFMVFRQLEQNVKAFWENVARASESPEDLEWTAAKIMGRWRSGAPLVLSPWRDRTELAGEDAFSYAKDDPHGFKCPFGAHIRRINPRDSKLADEPALAARISKQHRILRRGRPYGPPLSPDFSPAEILESPDDGAERGLHFICFQGDLSRQFEFVQQAWAQSPQFTFSGERDAVLGQQPDEGGTFVLPCAPVRKRFDGFRSVVRVVGGAYFFAPSHRMLAYLAIRAVEEGSRVTVHAVA